MTPQDFIVRWQRAHLSERSAAQQHFIDLCSVLGQPTPAAADPDGAWYTFERGVSKSGGGKGWADVWMREHFAWEYKGKHKDLVAAYQQLQLYREDLENPPLLVVCDLDRFEIHTNFTNTPKEVHAFNLAGLAEPKNLDVLRRLFTDPLSLKPRQSTKEITEEIAGRFGKLAEGLRDRKFEPARAAHFLMKLMFCMFAEGIGLLDGKPYSKILTSSRWDPKGLARKLGALFEAMAKGTEFGAETIKHFNGGLFADADVLELTQGEIQVLIYANERDWSNVEPSIFGTLFERILDPAKRSQIGAHYTSKEDILTLLEPVVMAPLRREWQEVKAKCDQAWLKVQEDVRRSAQVSRPLRGKDSKARQDHDKLLDDFLHRLATVKVLDPACGSGNFLYVAINLLLDLEKQVITYGANRDYSRLPHVRPTQLAGIEINPYAQQLAQVVIWIGYLQWMHHNGFIAPNDPVLEPIENIKQMDAILDLTDPENPKEPEWPEAEFIVGNPPFLGGKRMRSELGDQYLDCVFSMWQDRVPPEADLCCYWFEKAREQIEKGKAHRAGLLATQGIRGGANRAVLRRIKESGDIFFAESDREWILEGANVHISMVGFDNGAETIKALDKVQVRTINANLTSDADTTQAGLLPQNLEISYMGTTKGGAFDIPPAQAMKFLHAPNAHGKPNSQVVLPWFNGSDITKRNRENWIIDFGCEMVEGEACGFEGPFEYVREYVLPVRKNNNRQSYRDRWWLHVEPRPEMRKVMSLPRFLTTPRVSKHRLFVWVCPPTIPDSAVFVFARSDDSFFGILQSRVHELWALRQGTRLETRPRYTPTSCFETFPFPHATVQQETEISNAAKELDRLRTNWLNPPEWTRTEILEFPGTVRGPWARFVESADANGIGTVRYPRLVPRSADFAKLLEKRTLTNLYNERPTWLDLAHKKLDAAVFAAYGWQAGMSDEEVLRALLTLNLEQAKTIEE